MLNQLYHHPVTVTCMSLPCTFVLHTQDQAQDPMMLLLSKVNRRAEF